MNNAGLPGKRLSRSTLTDAYKPPNRSPSMIDSLRLLSTGQISRNARVKTLLWPSFGRRSSSDAKIGPGVFDDVEEFLAGSNDLFVLSNCDELMPPVRNGRRI